MLFQTTSSLINLKGIRLTKEGLMKGIANKIFSGRLRISTMNGTGTMRI